MGSALLTTLTVVALLHCGSCQQIQASEAKLVAESVNSAHAADVKEPDVAIDGSCKTEISTYCQATLQNDATAKDAKRTKRAGMKPSVHKGARKASVSLVGQAAQSGAAAQAVRSVIQGTNAAIESGTAALAQGGSATTTLPLPKEEDKTGAQIAAGTSIQPGMGASTSASATSNKEAAQADHQQSLEAVKDLQIQQQADEHFANQIAKATSGVVGASDAARSGTTAASGQTTGSQSATSGATGTSLVAHRLQESVIKGILGANQKQGEATAVATKPASNSTAQEAGGTLNGAMLGIVSGSAGENAAAKPAVQKGTGTGTDAAGTVSGAGAAADGAGKAAMVTNTGAADGSTAADRTGTAGTGNAGTAAAGTTGFGGAGGGSTAVNAANGAAGTGGSTTGATIGALADSATSSSAQRSGAGTATDSATSAQRTGLGGSAAATGTDAGAAGTTFATGAAAGTGAGTVPSTGAGAAGDAAGTGAGIAAGTGAGADIGAATGLAAAVAGVGGQGGAAGATGIADTNSAELEAAKARQQAARAAAAAKRAADEDTGGDDGVDAVGGASTGGTARRLAATANDAAAQKVAVKQKRTQGHRSAASNQLEQAWNKTSSLLNMNIPYATLSKLDTDARISRCLLDTAKQSRTSSGAGGPKVSNTCMLELNSFFIERAQDVTMDWRLVHACMADISTLCSNLTYPAADLVPCLKRKKRQLHPLCRAVITNRQLQAAGNVEMDPRLTTACTVDLDRLCADAAMSMFMEEGGQSSDALDCLEQSLLVHAPGESLSIDCQQEMLRAKMEESEDMRFNWALSSSCAQDRHDLCPGVKPEGPGALACLEQAARHRPGTTKKHMSAECRERVLDNAWLRAHDARLHWQVRMQCGNEVSTLCSTAEAALLHDPLPPLGSGLSIYSCLRRHLSQLPPKGGCKPVVHQLVTDMYLDTKLDQELVQACHDEIMSFCTDASNALYCLQAAVRQKKDVNPRCGEMVHVRLRAAVTDVAFMPHLVDTCREEMGHFCEDAHEYPGGVLDCLVDARNEQEFGDKCRDVLVTHFADAVHDLQLLHGLSSACKDDLATLCAGVEPTDGKALACLQHHRADISVRSCRVAFLRLMGFVVEDHRLNPEMLQSCKMDIQKRCAGVVAGEGRMQLCLRTSEADLDPDCRAAVQRVEVMMHEDVRLNPHIQSECPLAMSLYCRGIPPGDARVLTCLHKNMKEVDFPTNCKEVLTQQLSRAMYRYSLNARLRRACSKDVAKVCQLSEHPRTAKEDRAVLQCLAANASEASAECRAEVAGLVRLHFTAYRVDTPTTSHCDGDVLEFCHADKLQADHMEAGHVLKCLVSHYSRLSKPCWALVSLFDDSFVGQMSSLEKWHLLPEADPKGDADVSDATVNKVADAVRRKMEPHIISNLEKKIDREMAQQSDHTIAAVAAAVAATSSSTNAYFWMTSGLFVAVVASAVFFYRRARRRSPGGTLVVKDARV